MPIFPIIICVVFALILFITIPYFESKRNGKNLVKKGIEHSASISKVLFYGRPGQKVEDYKYYIVLKIHNIETGQDTEKRMLRRYTLREVAFFNKMQPIRVINYKSTWRIITVVSKEYEFDKRDLENLVIEKEFPDQVAEFKINENK